jgi:phosphotransferase system HPr (HPr) family protein
VSVIAREVSILNSLGLHARAAARFVQTANRFQSAIRVTHGDRTVDGKSIMGILLLAAARGTVLTIAADGPDAAAALSELCALVASGFGEDR